MEQSLKHNGSSSTIFSTSDPDSDTESTPPAEQTRQRRLAMRPVVSQHVTMSPCQHFALSLGIMPPDHHVALLLVLHNVTMGYYITMLYIPCYYTAMSCHHVMSPCHVTMSCHHVMSPSHFTMSFHHVVSPCYYTAMSCHIATMSLCHQATMPPYYNTAMLLCHYCIIVTMSCS